MSSPEPFLRSMRKGGWDSRRIPPRGAKGRISPSLDPSISSSYLHYHGIKERVEAWLADLLLVEPDDPLLHLHGLIGAEITARKQLDGAGPGPSRSASRLAHTPSRSPSSLQRPDSVAEEHTDTEPSADASRTRPDAIDVETDGKGDAGLGGLAPGEFGIKALITVQGLGPAGGPMLFIRRMVAESASLPGLAQWCEELAQAVRERLLPSEPSEKDAGASMPVSPVDKAVSKLKSLWDGTNRMQEVFEWLDQDNSGYIDHTELRSAMQLLGAPISEEEAMSVLRFLDTNGDGKINYAEFQQALVLVPSANDELQHWLASLNLPGLAARCLPSAGPDDALRALRALSFQELYGVSHNITSALAHHLWSSLQSLKAASLSRTPSSSSVSPSHLLLKPSSSAAAAAASSSAAPPAEAAAKFAVGSRHMVTNHSLYRLNQGIENIVGFPNSQVLEAIQAEHCSADDSEDDFLSFHGVRSTPQQEWTFLVTPSECGDAVREGRVVATVRELMKHPLAGEAGLRAEELMAMRLCTGPMLCKYNASLRGKGSRDFAALKGNAYATTIHAIVSGISKLSRFSKFERDQKVFVGLEGLLLPECLWKEDGNGHRGGVVKGMLSTTSTRDLEMSLGQIDRGASVCWLSQRPSEEEVLFPPCSHLEVLHEGRTEFTSAGPVLLVPLRIHVNNNTLTWD